MLTILSRNDVTNSGVEVGTVKALLRIRALETGWQMEQLRDRARKDGTRVLAELRTIAREYSQVL